MKRLSLLLLIVGTLVLAGCVGQDGSAYLAYSWVSTPLYLYDENPSTPSTVFNGTYFESGPGTYYMEYIAWNSSAWWMIYKIEIEEGNAFWKDGDDLYFEMTLYSTGPTLWRWSISRSITGQGPQEPPDASPKIIVGAERTGGRRGPVEGTEERTVPGGKITIEYGRLQQ